MFKVTGGEGGGGVRGGSHVQGDEKGEVRGDSHVQGNDRG